MKRFVRFMVFLITAFLISSVMDRYIDGLDAYYLKMLAKMSTAGMVWYFVSEFLNRFLPLAPGRLVVTSEDAAK